MSGRMTYGPRGSNHGTPISERDRVPGEMIGDWFHPYDGSAPTRITETTEVKEPKD